MPDQYDLGVSRAFLGLGGSRATAPRRALWLRAAEAGFAPVDAVHPAATISGHALLGAGVTLLPGAIVNAGAHLGDHVIVNSGAVVEHDCRLGDFVHIATGAALASGVTIEDGAHVGIGASVREGTHIGAGSTVGAGAVVIRDVPAGITVVGMPARPLHQAKR